MTVPCDSIITTSVDIGKVDLPLLDKAAKALGWAVLGVGNYVNAEGRTVTVRDGKLIVRSVAGQSDVSASRNTLMQAYSRQVVGAAARKFGWSVKQTGQNTATLGRS